MSQTVLSYKLESFEGPLDLLLQLIARNKLNIYDIPLLELIDQYLEQIKLLKEDPMEVGSEFLEMASRLLYIKTVSLLPKHEDVVKLKEELTGELLEYMVCQQMAKKLSEMQGGFNKFIREPAEYDFDKTYDLIHEKEDMFSAYLSAVGRGKRKMPVNDAPFRKIVAKRIVSVSNKIVFDIRNLFKGGKKSLQSLYKTAHSRSELVATFLAVLELCKANRVKVEGEGDGMEITLIKGHKKNEQ